MSMVPVIVIFYPCIALLMSKHKGNKGRAKKERLPRRRGSRRYG
jgi:hypothetical protein